MPSEVIWATRRLDRRVLHHRAKGFPARAQIVALPVCLIHVNAVPVRRTHTWVRKADSGRSILVASALRRIIPRDEACLLTVDANSAEAFRARALRVYQFAWNFPNEAATFLEFAAELEARADALSGGKP